MNSTEQLFLAGQSVARFMEGYRLPRHVGFWDRLQSGRKYMAQHHTRDYPYYDNTTASLMKLRCKYIKETYQ